MSFFIPHKDSIHSIKLQKKKQKLIYNASALPTQKVSKFYTHKIL